MREIRIAVDLMGCDTSPRDIFDYVVEASRYLGPSHSILVLAEQSALKEPLSCPQNIQILYTKDSIGMDENPLLAVRRKRESSMSVACRLLANKEVDAVVSAGNTGALIANSILSLPMLKGIERPALLAELPTATGTVAVLDVGANLSCKPEHLLQFARLGAIYQQIRHQQVQPKVGLLNIGSESQKGTLGIRKTYLELQSYSEKHPDHMHFCGNIEGAWVFQGNVDVLVTEGFTGNIFLKTSEGVSAFILDAVNDVLTEKSDHQSDEIINTLQRKLHYAEYFGAILTGLDGLVIKVHGYSSKKAFLSGIFGAFKLSEENLISLMKQQLDR